MLAAFIHDDEDSGGEGFALPPIFMPLGRAEQRRWEQEQEQEDDIMGALMASNLRGRYNDKDDLARHDWIPGQELMNQYIEGAAHNSPLICINVPVIILFYI